MRGNIMPSPLEAFFYLDLSPRSITVIEGDAKRPKLLLLFPVHSLCSSSLA
jgi:hypothetical protein